jgi:hypothetical protein
MRFPCFHAPVSHAYEYESRRRSSKEAIRGTSIARSRECLTPDRVVCGTEGHRVSLNRETEPLFRFLESCASGATPSYLKLSKQCSCHHFKRSLVQLRAVKVLSQHSHREAPRIGCTLQPNLRTADIAAYTLNFYCCKNLLVNLLHSSHLRDIPWTRVCLTMLLLHGILHVQVINMEVVGGLVPLRCTTKVLSFRT